MNIELIIAAAISTPIWAPIGYHVAAEAWHWLRTPQQRWVEPVAELDEPSIPPAFGLVLEHESAEVSR